MNDIRVRLDDWLKYELGNLQDEVHQSLEITEQEDKDNLRRINKLAQLKAVLALCAREVRRVR